MIFIRRSYTPRPGSGGLTGHPKDLQKATVDAGFPPLTVYDESRARVRQAGLITEIFSRIYPVLASTHVTEVYEEID